MRLSKTASFFLQASLIVSFLAGSSAPTPLYPVYQAAWGFSPITVTVIFGIYAIAVLATLLILGALSDFVGRRPVLLVATLVQAATMLVFIRADGLGALIAARVVQGIATGAAAGAIGAGMLDLDKQRGAIANAVGPMLGTATGALVSGLMVQWLPLPTKLVFAALGVIFVAQAIGVALMPETVTPRAGALASLRPKLHVAPHLRQPVMLVAPALVGAWSLVGFYGALGPALVRRVFGGTSLALGGLVLFVVAASGALMVLFTHTQPSQRMMRVGLALLLGGVLVTLLAIPYASMPLFFVGGAISGAGFGASFQGSIRSVVMLAAAHERAGALSVLYVIAYLAMGLPAVIGGVRVVYGGGLVGTAREYGVAVMVLAAVALVGSFGSVLTEFARYMYLRRSPLARARSSRSNEP